MKKLFQITGILLFIALANSCTIYVQPCSDNLAPSRNLNVCGHLKDSVILYAVFVDVGIYHPFTEYDITSTMDSIQKACNWIECNADFNNIPLSIKPVMHKTKNKWSFNETKVQARLDHKKVYSDKIRHANFINCWMNNISKYIHRGLRSKNSQKVATRNQDQRNTEGVIAKLRNEYKTDNIALMIFVNGYYEQDFSATFNSYTSGPNVEFSLITKKNPAVIAHEFLHLFGAVDLYPTSYHAGFNFEEIVQTYPDEIMRIQHKEISKLSLSPITKYYIGWIDEMCKADTRLLYHKANVLGY